MRGVRAGVPARSQRGRDIKGSDGCKLLGIWVGYFETIRLRAGGRRGFLVMVAASGVTGH